MTGTATDEALVCEAGALEAAEALVTKKVSGDLRRTAARSADRLTGGL